MFEQRFGQAHHRIAVFGDDFGRTFVLLSHNLAHFGIDANRCLFREVTMLSNLAAEEDLFFLLPKGQRAQLRHAVLADHRAGEFGGFLDIVRCSRGDVAEEVRFRNAATHQN